MSFKSLDKFIVTLLLLFTGFAGVKAQIAVGSWKQFSSFSTIDRVVDTPDKVFYLTCGQLYSYDKENDESYCYTSGNRLSDSNISDIYYNAGKKQLAVIYKSCNIDLIDNKDRVYNMPDIVDASLDIVPVINDVAFDGDKMYVVTNFGIVVFNVDKKEVVTAGNYGSNYKHVEIVENNIWVQEWAQSHNIADKDANLTSIKAFTLYLHPYETSDYCRLEGSKMVFIGKNNSELIVKNMVPVQGLTTDITSPVTDTNIRNLCKLQDGSVMCHSNTKLYIIATDATVSTYSLSDTPLETQKVGSVFESKSISSLKGLDELWVGSDEGLASYSLKDGNLTLLSEAIHQDDALTFVNVGRLSRGAKGDIYATSFGYSLSLKEQVNPEGNSSAAVYYVNKISSDGIEDAAPVNYTIKNKNQIGYDTAPVGFKSGTCMVENPKDPGAYIIGSMFDGFYYIKDQTEVAHYYEDNSKMHTTRDGFCLRADGCDFDRYGNLWVAQQIAEENIDKFHMLEASKVGKETTAADWQSIKGNIADDECNGIILACKQSDNVFYADASYAPGITVIKTRGTVDVKDDQVFTSTGLVDQDGLAYSYTYIYCMTEDQRGRVWIGTDNGVVEISRPDAINGSTFSVNHLKVPRKDGTNFADYLLDGEMVLSIAIDPSNRKWITTMRSGVYLVSENGDEILEHFDPTNSPLTDYAVISAVCGNNNEVYFGTLNGLFMYSSTSAPAREDYSEVYAFPNPVRPDYTGLITITGLMENSLVKIADVAGNVFFQGTSDGGMIVWNGCDGNGRRVKSGVYYVFASTGGDGMESNGAVTKILVVN